MILSAAMREAIKINAEREHFSEAYEGFNDCDSRNGKACDCGKAEAEYAWRMIQLEEGSSEGNEYEVQTFPEVADALAQVRKQHKKGKPIVWTGPDRLHHSIAAGCPPPSDLFSPESLEYAKDDQGQSFWDVYTMVAFQIGFHNGVIRTLRKGY